MKHQMKFLKSTAIVTWPKSWLSYQWRGWNVRSTISLHISVKTSGRDVCDDWFIVFGTWDKRNNLLESNFVFFLGQEMEAFGPTTAPSSVAAPDGIPQLTFGTSPAFDLASRSNQQSFQQSASTGFPLGQTFGSVVQGSQPNSGQPLTQTFGPSSSGTMQPLFALGKITMAGLTCFRSIL